MYDPNAAPSAAPNVAPDDSSPASEPTPERLDALLTFWFGSPGPDPDVGFRQAWFTRDDAFDAALRERFGALVERALAEPGAFSHWLASPRGTLGLLLLTDQLSRNLFRGTPRAFAADPLARQVATDALARGLDRELPLVARVFVYLPFEHAESLEDQRRSVAHFAVLAEDARRAWADGGADRGIVESLDRALDYAFKHLEAIAKYGRFPHRNAALSRASTPEEEAYLAAGGGF